MNDHDYNPNSIDAVLSRIEGKLDNVIETQASHATSIGKLWAALGRLDVRVAAIATGICVVVGVVKFFWGK